MCIHITDSLCHIAETKTILQSNHMPVKINFKMFSLFFVFAFYVLFVYKVS